LREVRNDKDPQPQTAGAIVPGASEVLHAAHGMPPGAERDRLVQKALESEAAANIDRWLSSSGPQRPK
jgi:hypothetical protein